MATEDGKTSMPASPQCSTDTAIRTQNVMTSGRECVKSVLSVESLLEKPRAHRQQQHNTQQQSYDVSDNTAEHTLKYSDMDGRTGDDCGAASSADNKPVNRMTERRHRKKTAIALCDVDKNIDDRLTAPLACLLDAAPNVSPDSGIQSPAASPQGSTSPLQPAEQTQHSVEIKEHHFVCTATTVADSRLVHTKRQARPRSDELTLLIGANRKVPLPLEILPEKRRTKFVIADQKLAVTSANDTDVIAPKPKRGRPKGSLNKFPRRRITPRPVSHRKHVSVIIPPQRKFTNIFDSLMSTQHHAAEQQVVIKRGPGRPRIHPITTQTKPTTHAKLKHVKVMHSKITHSKVTHSKVMHSKVTHSKRTVKRGRGRPIHQGTTFGEARLDAQPDAELNSLVHSVQQSIDVQFHSADDDDQPQVAVREKNPKSRPARTHVMMKRRRRRRRRKREQPAAQLSSLNAVRQSNADTSADDKDISDDDTTNAMGAPMSRRGSMSARHKYHYARSKHRNVVDPVFIARVDELVSEFDSLSITPRRRHATNCVALSSHDQCLPPKKRHKLIDVQVVATPGEPIKKRPVGRPRKHPLPPPPPSVDSIDEAIEATVRKYRVSDITSTALKHIANDSMQDTGMASAACDRHHTDDVDADTDTAVVIADCDTEGDDVDDDDNTDDDVAGDTHDSTVDDTKAVTETEENNVDMAEDVTEQSSGLLVMTTTGSVTTTTAATTTTTTDNSTITSPLTSKTVTIDTQTQVDLLRPATKMTSDVAVQCDPIELMPVTRSEIAVQCDNSPPEEAHCTSGAAVVPAAAKQSCGLLPSEGANLAAECSVSKSEWHAALRRVSDVPLEPMLPVRRCRLKASLDTSSSSTEDIGCADCMLLRRQSAVRGRSRRGHKGHVSRGKRFNSKCVVMLDRLEDVSSQEASMGRTVSGDVEHTEQWSRVNDRIHTCVRGGRQKGCHIGPCHGDPVNMMTSSDDISLTTHNTDLSSQQVNNNTVTSHHKVNNNNNNNNKKTATSTTDSEMPMISAAADEPNVVNDDRQSSVDVSANNSNTLPVDSTSSHTVPVVCKKTKRVKKAKTVPALTTNDCHLLPVHNDSMSERLLSSNLSSAASEVSSKVSVVLAERSQAADVEVNEMSCDGFEMSENKQMSHHASEMSENKQMSHHTSEISENKQTSHNAKKMSGNKQMSHNAREMSENKQTSHNAREMSENKQTSPNAKEMSENKQTSYNTIGMSDGKQTSHNTSVSKNKRTSHSMSEMSENKQTSHNTAEMSENKRTLHNTSDMSENKRTSHNTSDMSENKRTSHNTSDMSENKRTSHNTSDMSENKRTSHNTSEISENKRTSHNTSDMLENKRTSHNTSDMSENKQTSHNTTEMSENKQTSHNTTEMSENKQMPHNTTEISENKRTSHNTSDMSGEKRTSHNTSDMSENKRTSHNTSDMSENKRTSHNTSDMSENKQPSHNATEMSENKRTSHNTTEMSENKRTSHDTGDTSVHNIHQTSAKSADIEPEEKRKSVRYSRKLWSKTKSKPSTVKHEKSSRKQMSTRQTSAGEEKTLESGVTVIHDNTSVVQGEHLLNTAEVIASNDAMPATNSDTSLANEDAVLNSLSSSEQIEVPPTTENVLSGMAAENVLVEMSESTTDSVEDSELSKIDMLQRQAATASTASSIDADSICSDGGFAPCDYKPLPVPKKPRKRMRAGEDMGYSKPRRRRKRRRKDNMVTENSTEKSSDVIANDENDNAHKSHEKLIRKKCYQTAGLYSNTYKDDREAPLDGRAGSRRSWQYESTDHEFGLMPKPLHVGRYEQQKRTSFQLPYTIWSQFKHQQLKSRHKKTSPHYKKLRNNVYIDARPPSRNFEPHPCNCEMPTSPDVRGCGDNCLNRLVYTECHPSTCPVSERCCNQRLQRHEWAPGLQRFLTADRGYGIRSTQPITAGNFILEYLGEVVSDAEFRRRMSAEYRTSRHHYCLSLHRGTLIDGYRMGSIGRFVNHSCEPNCEMQKWNVNGLYRMALFALVDIPPDTELTYDYNFDCYNMDSQQTCKCGSKLCRGVVGGRTQRHNGQLKTTPGGSCVPTLAPPVIDKRSSNLHRQNSSDKRVSDSIRHQTAPPKLPSHRERCFVQRHSIFLLRNLKRVREMRQAPSGCGQQIVNEGSATSGHSLVKDTNGFKKTDVFLTQLTALKTPRSVKTRNLVLAEENCELTRTARLAQVLRHVYNEMTHCKDDDGKPLSASLMSLALRKKHPGCYALTDNPIDLKTIGKRILTGHYGTTEAFDTDVLGLFRNLQAYCSRRPEAHTLVSHLRRVYAAAKHQVAPQLADIIGVSSWERVDEVPSSGGGDDERLTDDSSVIRNRKQEESCVSPLSEEKEDEDKEDEEEEEVIRCVCNIYRDEGLMIQCDRCQTWQHCDCMGETGDTEHYMCELCLPRAISKEVFMVPQPTDAQPGFSYFMTLMRDTSLQVRAGDCVYVTRLPVTASRHAVRPPYTQIDKTQQLDIFRVERLWINDKGERCVFGHHYLRPAETFHEPSRRFYHNEVFRVPLYECMPLSAVVGCCYVMDVSSWRRGRPRGAQERDVYVCEYRLDRTAHLFYKIARPRYPINCKSYCFDKFDKPLQPKRTYSPHVVPDEYKRRTAAPQEKRSEVVQTTNSDSEEDLPLATVKQMKVKRKCEKLDAILVKLLAAIPGKNRIDITYLLDETTARRHRAMKTN